METSLTLATVLTSVAVVAIVVTQLVEYLQWSLALFAAMNGRAMAFIISAVIYVAAWWTVTDRGAESVFAAVLAWLGCGLAIMGTHQFQKEKNLTLPKATED